MTKRGYIKPYKTYVFRDKDPIIDSMRTAVQDSGDTYRKISEQSGVTASTLRAWFGGRTKRPQFCTIQAVAIAIGKELQLIDRSSKVVPLRRKAG